MLLGTWNQAQSEFVCALTQCSSSFHISVLCHEKSSWIRIIAIDIRLTFDCQKQSSASIVFPKDYIGDFLINSSTEVTLYFLFVFDKIIDF